jgi:hypothetical protein
VFSRPICSLRFNKQQVLLYLLLFIDDTHCGQENIMFKEILLLRRPIENVGAENKNAWWARLINLRCVTKNINLKALFYVIIAASCWRWFVFFRGGKFSSRVDNANLTLHHQKLWGYKFIQIYYKFVELTMKIMYWHRNELLHMDINERPQWIIVAYSSLNECVLNQLRCFLSGQMLVSMQCSVIWLELWIIVIIAGSNTFYTGTANP